MHKQEIRVVVAKRVISDIWLFVALFDAVNNIIIRVIEIQTQENTTMLFPTPLVRKRILPIYIQINI